MATALADRLQDVIELEAQRLEMTCAQIDDEVFSRERDVVLEEVAERHTPWSDLQDEISRAVWGKDHPYARGTHQVAEATKDDACRFFSGHYAPDRLMLVVTGNFDLDKARDAIRNPSTSVGSKDAVMHTLALQRLRQVMARADEENDWITDVRVATQRSGQAQLTLVTISVNDPKRLDDAVKELFARAPKIFADLSPYQAARLLGQLRNRYVASYESFETRGAWLADYLTYTRHNGFMVAELDALTRTSVPDADHYAQTLFVRSNSHVALVEPSGKTVTATPAAVASGHELDLAPWRAPVEPMEAQRPIPAPATRVSDTLEERVLANGLRVLLAPDPTSTLVDARLVFPYGSASDPPDRHGRASAVAHLLEPNPHRRYSMHDALMLDWGLSVGTQLDHEVHETSTVFSARGTSNRADWHVWHLLWLIDQCNYMDESVESFRDTIARAKAHEGNSAKALVLQLLFGAGHPYATPPPASEAWSWLTSDELERYLQTHYVPRGATLIVTGGFEVKAMWLLVEELFGPWRDLPALMVAFATSSDPTRDQAAWLVLNEMGWEGGECTCPRICARARRRPSPNAAVRAPALRHTGRGLPHPAPGTPRNRWNVPVVSSAPAEPSHSCLSTQDVAGVAPPVADRDERAREPAGPRRPAPRGGPRRARLGAGHRWLRAAAARARVGNLAASPALAAAGLVQPLLAHRAPAPRSPGRRRLGPDALGAGGAGGPGACRRHPLRSAPRHTGPPHGPRSAPHRSWCPPDAAAHDAR
jgi:zinc protease